jgi:hypothetical protein
VVDERTASAHACAGLVCRAGKYAMSVTASPALITASCAAATNERPVGYRRNSEVCDKNTRRGGGSLAITHSIPALTQRENTNSPAKLSRVHGTAPSQTPGSDAN